MHVADPLPGGRRDCVSAKASRPFVEWVRQQAARRGVSISALIEVALIDHATRSGDEAPPAR